MSKLDQVVFLIENGKIVESKIRDLDGFVDETTTPHGVAARFHVRNNELWTWGHQGSFPRCVNTFDTEEEATDALEETFIRDFWNCPEICAFATREDAEAALKDMLEDAA